MAPQRQYGGVGGGVDGALEWPRLHRWLAALMAGLAFGFLARTGRLETLDAAARLARLQAELRRSSAALLAAEHAAAGDEVAAVTVVQPAMSASAPPARTGAAGRAGSAARAPAARARPHERSRVASDVHRPPAAVPANVRPAPEPEPTQAVGPDAASPEVGRDAADKAAENDDTADSLSEDDVRAFLTQFERAYERLDAVDLSLLFSEDATDNDRIGRTQIALFYDDKFGPLESARYILRRVEIRVDGVEAEAVAPVTIAFSDKAGESWMVDSISHWWILQTDGGMTITRLDHNDR